MGRRYQLILDDSGDISILRLCVGFCYKVTYHKSYNPGDDLKENLLKAYEKWEELNTKGDEEEC